MARPKVCVSFDYENDKNFRNTLRLWNGNENIDFDIIDNTPNEINSYDVGRIKAVLTTKIDESDVLIVISGDYINTPHKDRNKIGCINWQNWECKKALELNKKIILIKLRSTNQVPKELLGKPREEIVGLELEKVNKSINRLTVH